MTTTPQLDSGSLLTSV